MGEKCYFHGKCSDLLPAANLRRLYFPSDGGGSKGEKILSMPPDGRHAEDFFTRKILRLQLTTRPLKPLGPTKEDTLYFIYL
jgi:hypothetical protein